MVPASSVQESGLNSRAAPGSDISRILIHRHRLDVVLAVYPESLYDLELVLLMLVRAIIRRLRKRTPGIDRCVRRLN